MYVGGLDPGHQEAFLRAQGWFSGLDGAVRSAAAIFTSQVVLAVGPQLISRRSLLAQFIDSTPPAPSKAQANAFLPRARTQGLDPSPQSFLLIRRSGRLHRREHSRPRSMPMMDDETCGHGQRQLQRPPKASARGPRGWPSVQRPAWSGCGCK